MEMNHTSMTGPKSLPTASVPRVWAMNSDVQAFHRGQHGYARGDHAVAVEQGGAEQHQQHEQAGGRVRARLFGFLDQAEHGEGTALPVIIGAHDEQRVFDADGEQHGPDDEGEYADDGRAIGGQAGVVVEHLAQGVERAGADIAEHDAQRAQGEPWQGFAGGAGGRRRAVRCFVWHGGSG
jgi:hypothetical protein